MGNAAHCSATSMLKRRARIPRPLPNLAEAVWYRRRFPGLPVGGHLAGDRSPSTQPRAGFPNPGGRERAEDEHHCQPRRHERTEFRARHPVGAAGFITDTGVEWGRIMAMGTLIVIPPLLFTFFAARQIIAGMTAGAVKG